MKLEKTKGCGKILKGIYEFDTTCGNTIREIRNYELNEFEEWRDYCKDCQDEPTEEDIADE